MKGGRGGGVESESENFREHHSMTKQIRNIIRSNQNSNQNKVRSGRVRGGGGGEGER